MKKVKIGNCILFRDDCLKIMPKLPEKRIHLILCDLPYGTTDCAWDTIIPFAPMWEQYRRLAKERAAIVLTASQPFTAKLVSSNMKQFRYCWVWEKTKPTGFQHAKNHPLKSHEDIAVFGIKSVLYYPQGLRRIDRSVKASNSKNPDILERGNLRTTDYVQEFTNYPKSILRYATDADRIHPTQKPVALMNYLVRTYTKEGQRVLDNCMGSGTTGVACVETNRSFVGIEQNKEYFDICCDRINDALKAADYKARQRSLFRK